MKASDLGSLIRLRRKKLGYTQAQVAELCGTGTRFISDLENGKASIELGKAITVAASLGIDITAKERGQAS
ncbi:hypothetical protein MASR2M78_34060 [Treponema sp.]